MKQDVPVGVDARAFLCQQCGAPGFILCGDPPPMCAVCGKAVELAPRNFSIPSLPTGPDPEWSLAAGGRQQRLKSQEHARKGSFYDLSAVPAGMQELHQAGTRDAKVGALLARAFADARKALPSCRARADAGGGYREHAGQSAAPPLLQKTLVWIASRATALYANLNEAARARPWVEQALDVVSDPALRNLALIQLSTTARRAGAIDAAEQWLGACAPQPVDVEVDSAWRVQRCLLLADRDGWQEVTQTLGESMDDVPASLGHYVMMRLLRIASHEAQSRMDFADREFLRLNEIAIDADVEDCLQREPRLAPCREVIQRWRDELERKEGERRRAETRFGLIAGSVGIMALLLSPFLLWTGRSTLLSCWRPEPHAAASRPQCAISRFVLGSRVEQIDVDNLREANVVTGGTGSKRHYQIKLQHRQGVVMLTPGSCQSCRQQSEDRAQRINQFIKSSTLFSLREESSNLPTTLFGVILGFGALGLIAYGFLKALVALTGRPSSSSD
jgi:hypothetical protein